MARWWSLIVLAIVLGGLPTTAIGATAHHGGSPSSPVLTQRALASGASHACIVAGSGRPVIDWSKLHNPILAEPSGGVKDQAII